MWEFLATIGGILLFTVVPAVLILLFRDKVRGVTSRKSDTERQQLRAAWRERMMRPEIEKVEELCGGKLPQRLIDMYSNHQDFLLSHDVEVCAPGKNPQKDSWWIGDFEPLTVQDQNSTCDLTEFGKGCCFAGDGMGNFYWVPVDNEQRKDAPVYFACHDPWGNEKVADSLEEFLSWPRVSAGSIGLSPFLLQHLLLVTLAGGPPFPVLLSLTTPCVPHPLRRARIFLALGGKGGMTNHADHDQFRFGLPMTQRPHTIPDV